MDTQTKQLHDALDTAAVDLQREMARLQRGGSDINAQLSTIEAIRDSLGKAVGDYRQSPGQAPAPAAAGRDGGNDGGGRR